MTREQIKSKFIEEITCCSESDELQVRKLTPSEALRLQGLTEDEIEMLMNSGISVTDLYKLAGNSITIPCLESIFQDIFRKNERSEAAKPAGTDHQVCNQIVQIGHLIESKSGRKNQSPYRVYSAYGMCPTLMASMGCGGRSPLVVIKNGKYL